MAFASLLHIHNFVIFINLQHIWNSIYVDHSRKKCTIVPWKVKKTITTILILRICHFFVSYDVTQKAMTVKPASYSIFDIFYIWHILYLTASIFDSFYIWHIIYLTDSIFDRYYIWHILYLTYPIITDSIFDILYLTNTIFHIFYIWQYYIW